MPRKRKAEPAATSSVIPTVEPVAPVQHRYPVEALSDLIIRMHDGRNRHEFCVHKQIMAHACGYFRALISNPAEQEKMPLNIDLPSPCAWSVAQLQVFIGICYGEPYSDLLFALSTAPTSKAFVGLLYKKDAKLIFTADRSESSGNPWTVVDHTEEGQFLLVRADDTNLKYTCKPHTTILHPDYWYCKDTPVLQLIELPQQMLLAQYFQHDRLCTTLTGILLKLIDIGAPELVLNIVAECKSLPTLYTACVEKLRQHKWQTSDRDRLLKMPNQFLVDLLLPASN